MWSAEHKNCFLRIIRTNLIFSALYIRLSDVEEDDKLKKAWLTEGISHHYAVNALHDKFETEDLNATNIIRDMRESISDDVKWMEKDEIEDIIFNHSDYDETARIALIRRDNFWNDFAADYNERLGV